MMRTCVGVYVLGAPMSSAFAAAAAALVEKHTEQLLKAQPGVMASTTAVYMNEWETNTNTNQIM